MRSGGDGTIQMEEKWREYQARECHAKGVEGDQLFADLSKRAGSIKQEGKDWVGYAASFQLKEKGDWETLQAVYFQKMNSYALYLFDDHGHVLRSIDGFPCGSDPDVLITLWLFGYQKGGTTLYVDQTLAAAIKAVTWRDVPIAYAQHTYR